MLFRSVDDDDNNNNNNNNDDSVDDDDNNNNNNDDNDTDNNNYDKNDNSDYDKNNNGFHDGKISYTLIDKTNKSNSSNIKYHTNNAQFGNDLNQNNLPNRTKANFRGTPEFSMNNKIDLNSKSDFESDSDSDFNSEDSSIYSLPSMRDVEDNVLLSEKEDNVLLYERPPERNRAKETSRETNLEKKKEEETKSIDVTINCLSKQRGKERKKIDCHIYRLCFFFFLFQVCFS